jgi:hypothetical protein
MAIEPRRLCGSGIWPKTAPHCDFNCGKTGEPLAYFHNTESGREWYCHLSCLEEQLYLHQEMRSGGDKDHA